MNAPVVLISPPVEHVRVVPSLSRVLGEALFMGNIVVAEKPLDFPALKVCALEQQHALRCACFAEMPDSQARILSLAERTAKAGSVAFDVLSGINVRRVTDAVFARNGAAQRDCPLEIADVAVLVSLCGSRICERC